MKTPFGPVTLQCPAGTLYPARYDSINGLWRPIDGTTGEWVSECPCSGCAALRGAGWPDPHAQRVVDHPPLNTPLSAFTPAMLDALPVGSRFGRSVLNCYVMEKRADGWYYPDGDPAGDFGPGRFDPSRPLIRVGPEQASKSAPSAPLPDPWPNMIVDADVGSERHRARIFSAYMIGDRTWACIDGGEGRRDVQWTPNHIREVRTPDGVTLWKLPAANIDRAAEQARLAEMGGGFTTPAASRAAIRDAMSALADEIDAAMAEKVTAEPRPLSTYTADEIRAFPVGTEIDDPKAPTEEARNLRYCVLTPDGWTHGEWYMGPALTMDEFIQWEVPRQPAALVHFPAKVTP